MRALCLQRDLCLEQYALRMPLSKHLHLAAALRPAADAHKVAAHVNERQVRPDAQDVHVLSLDMRRHDILVSTANHEGRSPFG